MTKAIDTKIYVAYTKHMTRAKPYTYRKGYELIDQALVKYYYFKTREQIATDLNEYDHRVQWRIQTLLKLGVLPMTKRDFKKLARKVLVNA